jgi:hypothetical protein
VTIISDHIPDPHFICGHGVDLRHGDCQECRDEDHERYVGRVLDQTATLTHDAHRTLTDLRKAVNELTNGDAWDIEMAEGSDGSDALNELDGMLRHLRHVRRIVDARVKLWKETAPANTGDTEAGQ